MIYVARSGYKFMLRDLDIIGSDHVDIVVSRIDLIGIRL